MRRHPRSAVLALLAVAALAACGGGSDDDAPTTEDTPTTDAAVADPTTPPTDAAEDADDTAEDDTEEDGTAEDAAAPEPTADGAADEEEFVAAFAVNYAVFEDDEADACVGQSIVDAVSYEAIVDAAIAPDDVLGIITLDTVGLTIEQDALDPAVAQLASCGDLAAVALASGGEEGRDCAAGVITDELAAEQLLVQIAGLEPSDGLIAARDALTACMAE